MLFWGCFAIYLAACRAVGTGGGAAPPPHFFTAAATRTSWHVNSLQLGLVGTLPPPPPPPHPISKYVPTALVWSSFGCHIRLGLYLYLNTRYLACKIRVIYNTMDETMNQNEMSEATIVQMYHIDLPFPPINPDFKRRRNNPLSLNDACETRDLCPTIDQCSDLVTLNQYREHHGGRRCKGLSPIEFRPFHVPLSAYS